MFRYLKTRPNSKLAILVNPKCGCSTLLQVLYYTEYGKFFEATPQIKSIHKAVQGLLSTEEAYKKIDNPEVSVVTSIRNPYTRILSAFLDKILSFQQEGWFYRRNWTLLRTMYGFNHMDMSNQVNQFKTFVGLLERAYLQNNFEILRDIHFKPYSEVISDYKEKTNKPANIIKMENLSEDFSRVLSQCGYVDVDVPRFNTLTIEKVAPFKDYFSEKEINIIQKIYKDDFELGGYSLDL